MLEQMRESSKNGLTMVIFAIIMVVFAISFGAPMDGCQGGQMGPKFLADVNGHDVTSTEVGIVFNRANVNNMNEDQYFQEQSKALRAVLVLHLLADRARDLGMRVTTEEFKAYMSDPSRNIEFLRSYGQNGTLDGRYYENYVQNQLRVNLKTYEKFKREEILARKYLDLAEMQVGAFPGSVAEVRALRDTKVDLEFIKLTPGAIAPSIVVTDADALAWAGANADALEKAYEAKASVYKKPARYNVRRLFMPKPGANATEAQAKKLENAIGLAKKRILEDKEDFVAVTAELAPEYDKESKGAMGWKTQDNLDADIFKAIEGAKVDEIKEVDTDGAYMFVRLEGKEEATTTPLEEVKLVLAKEELQKERASDQITKRLEELRARAEKDDSSLSDALDALKAAEKAAAVPEEGEEVEGDEAKPAPESKWAGVRVDTTGKYNMEPKAPPANLFGGQIPPQLLAQFSAWDRVPKIGASSGLMLDSFKLTKAAPLGKSVYDVSGAKVIVRLKDREDPGAPAPVKDGEDAPADPTLEISQQVRSNVIAEVANPSNRTGWMTLFLYPEGDDYGPWVESIYDDAVRDGRIRFNPDQRTSKFLIEADATDPATAIKLDGLGEITPGAKKDADEKGEAEADPKKDAPSK